MLIICVDPIVFKEIAELAVAYRSEVCGFGIYGDKEIGSQEAKYFASTINYLKKMFMNVAIYCSRYVKVDKLTRHFRYFLDPQYKYRFLSILMLLLVSTLLSLLCPSAVLEESAVRFTCTSSLA